MSPRERIHSNNAAKQKAYRERIQSSAIRTFKDLQRLRFVLGYALPEGEKNPFRGQSHYVAIDKVVEVQPVSKKKNTYLFHLVDGRQLELLVPPSSNFPLPTTLER